jgi:hypothetical protein
MYLFYELLKILAPIPEEHPEPCNPSPCGTNAICKERNGVGSCTCLPEYFGDPNLGCKPECVTNNDCPREKACIQNKCKDPCPGVCGNYAFCRVINHNPSCSCLDGYTGDPLNGCHEIPQTRKKICLSTAHFKLKLNNSNSHSTYKTLSTFSMWSKFSM